MIDKRIDLMQKTQCNYAQNIKLKADVRLSTNYTQHEYAQHSWTCNYCFQFSSEKIIE